ncbi:MAG: hypothetical protein D3903_13000 [Candidatus Electrothrix sp. GM3_4]|nr:hypothetical protein [Candidatus Electrothrix sp. GM3_4]
MPLPYYCKWFELKDSYLQFRKKRKQHLAEAKQILFQDANSDTDAAASALQKVKKDDEQLQLWIILRCRFPALAITVFFLAGLCCFLICYRPSPSIRLELQTSTVKLSLVKEKNWEWRPSSAPAVTSIFMEGVFGITAPGLGLNNVVNTLAADGKSISLQYIEVSGDSRLEAEQNDGFNLYIYDGNIQGSFELQESDVRLDDIPEVKKISGPVPESLSFSAEVRGGQRLHIRLKGGKDFHIEGMQISSMDFQREDPPGSGKSASAITSGTILLPEIKRNVLLEEHDMLLLKDVTNTRLRLTVKTDGRNSFSLFFQGRADSLSAGPKEFEQNLTPSLLIWMYHQWEKSELGIFCAVLAVMLGLFWKVHNLLRTN